MVSHQQIFSNQRLNGSVNAYSTDFVKNLTMSNFTQSTHYSMSLMISYFNKNLTLSSDPVDFYTFKVTQINNASLDVPTNRSDLDLGHFFFILCSLAGVIFAICLLTGKLNFK